MWVGGDVARWDGQIALIFFEHEAFLFILAAIRILATFLALMANQNVSLVGTPSSEFI